MPTSAAVLWLTEAYMLHVQKLDLDFGLIENKSELE